MDEQQLQALIESAISAAKEEILSVVDAKNSGLAGNLFREFNKKYSQVAQPAESQDDSKEKLSLKALQQQIADLQNQLQEKDRKAYEASRNAAISSAVANSKALNPKALQKLFAMEYGEYIKQEGDQWYYDRDGITKPVDQVLNDYLASEEGSHFLPPSGVQGSGSVEAKPITPNTNKPATMDDLINQAFSNI